MKKKSFFGSLFSVITQAADLTTEAMNAVDQGAQKVTNAIDRMKIVREHCSAVQDYFNHERLLLESSMRTTEQFISAEEKMTDPMFKKNYLHYHDLLNPGEPYLSLSLQLAKMYLLISSFKDIQLQRIPKALPVDDVQTSIEISGYFNNLLTEHIGELKRTKQVINCNKKLAEAMRKGLTDNGLTLLWEKLMAS